MRLHELRMSAVGPFADEQVIDFDRLGAGGLFLFEGPTGVGKSTILDALTFALYGGLASDAGDPARMRSDFAGPDDRPEVALEFSVRGGRHRITRSPEHARAKKRGSGVTREKASVHLERRAPGGGWESRSHAKDEVGTIIGELLGLTRDQFRQVVLLPQGEFATFLRAGDDERREVLGRLFGTQFFRRITEQLQVRAQEATRALQSADSGLRARVAAACEAAGLDPQEHAELAERALPARLEGLVAVDARLARQKLAADLVADHADEAQLGARAVRSAAESVLALLEQRAGVQATLADAENRRTEHEQRQQRLERARRAIPVRPLLELADRAADRVTTLRAAVIAASPSGQPAAEHLEGSGWQALAEESAAARTAAGELAHLVVVEERLGEDRLLVGRQRAAATTLVDANKRAQERGGSIPVELTAAREALSAALSSAAGVLGTSALLEAVAGQAEAAGRVEELSAAVEQRRATRDLARRALDRADADHGVLVDQRLADVRGELAARLVPGDPCLVCGSPEHPAPARPVTAGITSEQVRAAAAFRDEARHVLDDAESAVVRAEADHEHALGLAGGLSAAQWQARIEELRSDLATAEAAQASVADLEAKVGDLVAEQDELSSRLLALAEEVAQAQSLAAHSAAELAVREEQVQAARAEHASVRERVDLLVTRAGSLDALSAAVHDLSRGLAEVSESAGRATAEAIASGFVDLAEARAALLSAKEIEHLDREVTSWESAVAAARARLDSREFEALAGVDQESAKASAQTAAEELGRIEEAARVAHEEATVATRARQRFSERLAEVQRSAAERNVLAASNEELVALDLYSRGMAGTPRMTLVTFVLRFWFEQVVAAANVRLDSMSSGKYELLRIDDAARKDARVGLGLAVLDRHTGRVRSPATLSGGESFYTSLALALGLADVVVAQAGGAQLDTLFIDEGFGSLDPDTLDDVMGVIDELRGNGRVIGIVSHVPELKERISERLTVRRIRPDGPSTVEVRA